MNLSETGISYRKSAIEGASPIGLIIVLFDTLAGDIRRGAAAIRKNDIETRCKELNHAELVLGRLESWIDQKNGGESAETLSRFYSYLRARMMEAAITKSASLLEAQMEMVLHVRAAWQLLDTAPPQPIGEQAETSGIQASASYALPVDTDPDRVSFSQTA